jgi:hypothetical protein
VSQITTWAIPAGPSGLELRQQANATTEALRSGNSGASAPSPTVPGMLWFDTSGGAGVLRIRNAADDGWIALYGGMSGRNMIANGSGRINQRGYVSGTATAAANQFTLDRWFVATSGQNIAFTGGDYGRVITAPAGGVSQVIDGADMVGGTYVINWTGTATCTVNGVAKAKGDTLSLTGGVNVKVSFFSGTFTDVQLEAGTIPTAFETTDFGAELLRCQRFAWVPQLIQRQMYSMSDNGASVRRAGALAYPVRMRAIPTVSYTLGFGTVFSFVNSTDGFTIQADAFDAASANTYSVTLVSAELTA